MISLRKRRTSGSGKTHSIEQYSTNDSGDDMSSALETNAVRLRRELWCGVLHQQGQRWDLPTTKATIGTEEILSSFSFSHDVVKKADDVNAWSVIQSSWTAEASRSPSRSLRHSARVQSRHDQIEIKISSLMWWKQSREPALALCFAAWHLNKYFVKSYRQWVISKLSGKCVL